jgi:hypothetical protein
LGLFVGLLQVVQQLEDAINGVVSLGTSLQESQDLVLNSGLGAESNGGNEQESNNRSHFFF